MSEMADIPTPRPRLVPLPVPWQLETETHLLITTSTAAGDRPTEVVFLARVLTSPSAAFATHTIRLRFHQGVAVRLIPHQEGMLPDLSGYDGSAVAPPRELQDDLLAIIKWSEEEWRRRGVCPASGFYRVQPSPWVEELVLDDEGLFHFLLQDRYASLEILAEDWSWESIARHDAGS